MKIYIIILIVAHLITGNLTMAQTPKPVNTNTNATNSLLAISRIFDFNNKSSYK